LHDGATLSSFLSSTFFTGGVVIVFGLHDGATLSSLKTITTPPVKKVDDKKELKVAPSCKPKTITTPPAKKVDDKMELKVAP
jgi:hypothetical protein